LDELTTGLDPQARRAMWDLVRNIRQRGKTVFLTTHFMEEAELLCDRVAIMDHGTIVALDTPENLISSLGTENRVVFVAAGRLDEGLLQALPGVSRVERVGERVVVHGQGDGLVSSVVNALEAGGVRFRDLRTEQPTLEDVFLALTGKEMRD
jgi:ABC-2 type transport system ATP-binding protein